MSPDPLGDDSALVASALLASFLIRKTVVDAVVDADINHLARQVSESSSLRREGANEYVISGPGDCRLR